ncbi:MAG: paraquat-inducible protein A [Gammaproteobacteria bacterium SG8_47]|nr:MAG: paraquat-inducible protein A [Gammaproteobacteria bacterium SG8_47]
MRVSTPTALRAGLVGCHACALVSRLPDAPAHKMLCPRCGATLHPRHPKSVAQTWALLIAACILYIPANLLPIMRTSALGATQSDTIMSGVIYFIKSGSWPLALVIFVASIVVPVAKLIVLVVLLVSVQRRSHWRPRDRMRLFRAIELIGPWSMVDVFVVTILVALVQLGGVATIEPGAGAVAFAAVVVLTMIAAETFDSRLIWDGAEAPHG